MNELLNIIELTYAELYIFTRQNQTQLEEASKKQCSELIPVKPLSKIEEAVSKMKANRVSGEDRIEIKSITFESKKFLMKIKDLCNQYYQNGTKQSLLFIV